jgi:hypothetical protein
MVHFWVNMNERLSRIFFATLLSFATVLCPAAIFAANATALFTCEGYPNNRPDLNQWAVLDSRQPIAKMAWSNGAEIRIELMNLDELVYTIIRHGQVLTVGSMSRQVTHLAMTAGGIELHCLQAQEPK